MNKEKRPQPGQFLIIKETRRCSQCEKNTVWFSIAHSDFECSICHDRKIDEKEKAQKTDIPKSVSGLPAEYKNCSFSNFFAECSSQQSATCVAADFCEDQNRIAIFYGPCGTGKTHLATSCLKRLSGIYKTAAEIQYEQKDKQSTCELWRKLSDCRLLVIDEVGRDSDESTQIFIKNIIHRRCDENKKTIISSNLDFDILLTYLGDMIISRTQNRGVFICFDGIPDHRSRLKNHNEKSLIFSVTSFDTSQKQCQTHRFARV